MQPELRISRQAGPGFHLRPELNWRCCFAQMVARFASFRIPIVPRKYQNPHNRHHVQALLEHRTGRLRMPAARRLKLMPLATQRAATALTHLAHFTYRSPSQTTSPLLLALSGTTGPGTQLIPTTHVNPMHYRGVRAEPPFGGSRGRYREKRRHALCARRGSIRINRPFSVENF